MAKVVPEPRFGPETHNVGNNSNVSDHLEITKSSRMILACLTNLQTALNGVLFAISKKSARSFFLVALSIVIDFIQLFSLVMPEQASLDFGLPQELNLLAEYAAYLRLGGVLKNSFGAFVTLIVAQGIIAFELGNVLYVGYGFTSQKLDQLWAVKLLRVTMPVFVGIMFIPLLSLLTNSFSCEALSTESCTILLPISILLIPIYITLGMLISISNFDPFPGSKSPAARSHSRINTLHLLMKACFVLVFAVFKAVDPTHSFQLKWSIFTALTTTLLAILFVLYQPYFDPAVGMLRIICSTALSWSSLCVLGHVYLGNSSDRTVITTALGGLPLILLLTRYIARHRQESLRSSTVEQCWTPYDVELKCRLELQEYWRSEALSEAAVGEIHKTYREALARFPRSSILCVFHASVLCTVIKQESPFLARRALMLADKRGLAIDLSFTVFRLQKTLDKGGQSTDVMTYFKVEKYMRDSLHKDKLACMQLLEFWKELSQRHPNAFKVSSLAKSIGSCAAQAKAAYSNILRTDPTPNVKTLRLFGTFLTDIANDDSLGTLVMTQASNLDAKNSDTNLDDISGGNIGVLVVNNDLDILSANTKAAEILDIASNSLTHQSFQSIFLPCLHSTCQCLLKNLIDLAFCVHFDKEFETFLVTRGGGCVEVLMKLKPVALDEHNFRLYVCFTQVSRANSQSFILCTEEGLIAGASEEFAHLAKGQGRKRMDVRGYDAAISGGEISDTCPDLAAIVDDLTRSDLIEVSRDIDICSLNQLTPNSTGKLVLQKENAHIQARKVTCLGFSFICLRIKNDEDTAEKSQEAASFDDAESDYADEEEIYEMGRAESVGHLDSVVQMDTSYFNDRGKNGSKLLETSSVSTTGTEKISTKAAAIRKMLQEEQRRSKMSPLLARLGNTSLRTSLFVCTLACCAYIYWQSALALFVRDVTFVNILGTRRSSLLTLAYATHTLWMHNMKILPRNDTEAIASARAQLAEAGERLKEVDTRLFEEFASYNNEQLNELYATPSVEFLSLQGNDVVSNKHTAYELTLRLAALAVQATTEPLSHFVEDNPFVFALMNNIYSEQSVMNKTFASVEAFENIARSSLSSIYLSFTIANALLAFIMLIVVFSSLQLGPLIGDNGRIENSKREVLSVFLTISKRTNEQIIARLTRRLSVIHHENEGLFMTEYEDIETDQNNSNRNIVELEAEAESHLRPEPIRNSGKSKASRRHFNDTSKHSLSRKLGVMLKMGSLLFIGAAYFASNFIVVTSLIASLEPAARTENLAGLQHTKLKYVSHHVRMLVTGFYSNRTYNMKNRTLSFSTQAANVVEAVTLLESVHNTLLYGDSEGLVGGIFTGTSDSANSRLLELYSMDGCFEWPESVTKTQVECERFLQGIMSSGLHVAIKRFGDFATSFAQSYTREESNTEQLRQLLSEGELSDKVELEHYFLETQSETAVKLLSESIKYSIDRTNDVLLAFLVSYIVGAALCQSLLVRRVLQQLDKEVKDTRSLLLLIPEDVLEASPQIQKVFVNSFAKQ